jgi:O-antigen/teichoic acid export membrane protein
MSLNRVIRGSFWLYVSGLASSFLGYLYWLLASQFVPPSTIGDAAAVIGVASLITAIFSLGISSGATRIFGQMFGQGDSNSLSVTFTSTLLSTIAINAFAASLFILLGSLLNLSRVDALYVAVLIVVNAFPHIPTALFNSLLRTSPIAISTIASSSLRLVLGIALLYAGTGFIGVIAAFIIAGVVQDVALLAMIRGLVSRTRPALSPVREALKAGIPAWIPSLIATAGSWVGILGVYGITGSQQAGTYYIAFNIAQIVYTLPLSFLGLMFPLLSGMEDGRKRATNRSVRLASAIIAPLTAIVIAYPYVPLSMLGPSYAASSLVLQILLIGCFVTPISSGFHSLVYAYGKYRYVTLLGLASNIPRIALYPFFVALWGDSGAALAYVSGFFAAATAVYFMAKKIGYSVNWGSSLIFAAIPLMLMGAMVLSGLHWLIGTAVILGASILVFARLSLITRADIGEFSSAFLSRKRLDQVYPYAKYILEVLYGK